MLRHSVEKPFELLAGVCRGIDTLIKAIGRGTQDVVKFLQLGQGIGVCVEEGVGDLSGPTPVLVPCGPHVLINYLFGRLPLRGPISVALIKKN